MFLEVVGDDVFFFGSYFLCLLDGSFEFDFGGEAFSLFDVVCGDRVLFFVVGGDGVVFFGLAFPGVFIHEVVVRFRVRLCALCRMRRAWLVFRLH
jgi:hypothetical protein